MMSRIRLAGIAGAGALFVGSLALGPSGYASTALGTMGTITLARDGGATTGYSGFGGGEFAAIQFDGMVIATPGAGTLPFSAPTTEFQTFCLERLTHVATGTQYKWTLGIAASHGGVAGGDPDPISNATAWLYGHFYSGAAAANGYDYTPGTARTVDAEAVQNAIWFLEDEYFPQTLADVETAHPGTKFWVDLANANAGSGIGAVKVLVLSDLADDSLDIQDVLVMDTDAPPPPPPGGGGRTPGFWSNKNGKAQMCDNGSIEPELQLLRDCCLRKANGDNFDPTTYTKFRCWLLDGNAVNMAYMLSVQMAAMKLNTEAGFVAGGALVYVDSACDTTDGTNDGKMSIGNLLTAANDALCADGYTPTGDANRAYQECLKNALDAANNNLNFVP